MAVKKTDAPVASKNRLHDYYTNTVRPELMKEKGYKNINEVPKIEKIVLNLGLGAEKDNSKESF